MTNFQKAAVAAVIIAAAVGAHLLRFSVTCAAAGGASDSTSGHCYLLDRWTGSLTMLGNARSLPVKPLQQ
ncbi:MAG: hypothetical protein IIZ92_25840 [Aquincola sp.]|nr:hypothetical protein [Aquincola sp.]